MIHSSYKRFVKLKTPTVHQETKQIKNNSIGFEEPILSLEREHAIEESLKKKKLTQSTQITSNYSKRRQDTHWKIKRNIYNNWYSDKIK